MKHIRWIVLVLIIGLAACQGQATEGNVVVEEPSAESAVNLPAEIDVQTAFNLQAQEDVVVVDVREQWEYDAGHVPGSVLIPLGELESRMSEIPQDKTIVTVCRSGNRSYQAMQILQQNGLDAVHSMEGGMIAWEQADYDMEY